MLRTCTNQKYIQRDIFLRDEKYFLTNIHVFIVFVFCQLEYSATSSVYHILTEWQNLQFTAFKPSLSSA